MRRARLCALLVMAIVTSTSAQAAGGQFYASVGGGLLLPEKTQSDVRIDYETTQNIDYIPMPPGPGDKILTDGFHRKSGTGSDIEISAGYDFGRVRAEIELGRKRTMQRALRPSDELLDVLNEDLNRNPGGFIGDYTPLSSDDVSSGRERLLIRTAMVNVLGDFDVGPRTSLFAGLGVGRARAKQDSETDKGWAWQFVAGARYSVSPVFDVGLKFRQLRTESLDMSGATATYPGNRIQPALCVNRPCSVIQTIEATLAPELRGRLKSESLLLFVSFKLGR